MTNRLNSNAFLFFFTVFLVGMYFMHQLLLPEKILIQARAKEIYIDEKARDLCQNWYYQGINESCPYEPEEEME